MMELSHLGIWKVAENTKGYWNHCSQITHNWQSTFINVLDIFSNRSDCWVARSVLSRYHEKHEQMGERVWRSWTIWTIIQHRCSSNPNGRVNGKIIGQSQYPCAYRQRWRFGTLRKPNLKFLFDETVPTLQLSHFKTFQIAINDCWPGWFYSDCKINVHTTWCTLLFCIHSTSCSNEVLMYLMMTDIWT